MKSLLVFAALGLSAYWLPAWAQEDEVVVFTMTADDMERIENSSAELKVLAHEADATCRQYPNEAQTLAGCAARNVFLDILQSRNI